MSCEKQDIIIIGCGPGSRKYLTFCAWEAAENVDILIGSARCLELFEKIQVEKQPVLGKVDSMLSAIEQGFSKGIVGVVVSGDPGFFSLAALVVNRFGKDRCKIIPGISSVQCAFAELGVSWSEAVIISAHGRVPAQSFREFSENPLIAVLCGNRKGQDWAAGLADFLRKSHRAYLCLNLGLTEQEIKQTSGQALRNEPAESLAVVVFHKVQGTDEGNTG